MGGRDNKDIFHSIIVLVCNKFAIEGKDVDFKTCWLFLRSFPDIEEVILARVFADNHSQMCRACVGPGKTYVLFSPFGEKNQASRDARTTKTRPMIIDQLHGGLASIHARRRSKVRW